MVLPKRKGFKDVTETTPQRHEEDKNVTRATKLYDALKANNSLPRTAKRPSPAKWAKEFITLEKYVSSSEIDSTLDWYIRHIKDEYVPKVFSALKFRTEFDRIQLAMQRSAPSVELSEISDDAKKIRRRADLQWPRGEQSKELQFIQLNLDYYSKQIRQPLLQLRADLEKDTDNRQSARMLRLLNWIIPMMSPATVFVEDWLREVNDKAWKWSGWKGNLFDWVLTDNNERIQQHFYGLVAEYIGDGGMWDNVLTEIRARRVK